MAISPWTKPLEMKIAPLPFEALAYGYEKKAKREEETDKLLSDVNESFLKINSIPHDTPRKQELVNGLQQEIYSLVDKYKGNISAALPELKALNRKVQYETSYGELGGIKERYNQFAAAEAKRAEAIKRYMMGEKGGMSEDEAAKAREYELLRMNKPIEKTPYGWSSYNTLPSQPHIDIESKVMEVAKELKPESIEQMTGLQYDKNTGYFVNLTTGENRLAADEIEEAAYRMVMQDREVNDYLKFKHTIEGNLENWSNILANSPKEGLIFDTPQGQIQVNPEKWLEDNYYSDVRNAARNAGNIYRQYESTIKADYKENWRERDAAKEARERSLLDFPLPAMTSATGLANMPQPVVANRDGTVQGAEEKADDGIISKVAMFIQTPATYIRSLFVNNFDPGAWLTGTPITKAGKQAEKSFQEAKTQLLTMLKGETKTKQQLIDEQADKLRQDYPEVATMFPKDEQVKTGTKGKFTYDKNATNVVNFVSSALQNSSTVIGNLLVPESPQLMDRIQKTYFNSSVFNNITYKLADGELGTKKEAEEALGYPGGVPQEVLDKAVFNGYGGFLNPGKIYGQIPNSEGVMQTIVIEPDVRTRELYTHSNLASKAFLDHKPQAQVANIRSGNVTTPYYFEYTPYINEDGTYSVKVKQYAIAPGNKKGAFIGEDDALNIYGQEHIEWLKSNSFNIK